MRVYTPINEFKIKSKETKEFLKKVKKMLNVKLEKIHVSPQVFSDLMESMSPARKSLYSDGIPFEGKLLVRK
jgi:hypothetical protein